MYIAILGRQPALGAAELERRCGAVRWFSDASVLVDTPSIDVTRLGGSRKIGRVVEEIAGTSWQDAHRAIIGRYRAQLRGGDHKITLGISATGFRVSPRDIQKTGLALRAAVRASGGSVRLVPNSDVELSTATSHHNKLGLSQHKIELLVVAARGRIVIAESIGAQNITAYARRDQQRPRRDAFVGMLPPKLAQIMLNLAAPAPGSRVLDPFCGTGVLLQEAALLGFPVSGTDLSAKMIRYARDNLDWLAQSHGVSVDAVLAEGDAMTTRWQPPIGAVVSETYLGQPFSAPPSPAKLAAVRRNCDHIISSFLTNLAPQLAPGTPVCLAVPAWRDAAGGFAHLSITRRLDTLGWRVIDLETATARDLLYFREDQVVARQILVLERSESHDL